MPPRVGASRLLTPRKRKSNFVFLTYRGHEVATPQYLTNRIMTHAGDSGNHRFVYLMRFLGHRR